MRDSLLRAAGASKKPAGAREMGEHAGEMEEGEEDEESSMRRQIIAEFVGRGLDERHLYGRKSGRGSPLYGRMNSPSRDSCNSSHISTKSAKNMNDFDGEDLSEAELSELSNR